MTDTQRTDTPRDDAAPGTAPRRPWQAPPEPKGPVTQVNELKDLVVSYTKQETVDPLKSLGRYLGFGVTGAVLIGVGWVFALLALLRGLQRIEIFNDTGAADGGTFSWAPYLIVAVVGLAVAGIYARLLSSRLKDDGSPR